MEIAWVIIGLVVALLVSTLVNYRLATKLYQIEFNKSVAAEIGGEVSKFVNGEIGAIRNDMSLGLRLFHQQTTEAAKNVKESMDKVETHAHAVLNTVDRAVVQGSDVADGAAQTPTSPPAPPESAPEA